MRGTLHLVAAEDLGWMLSLTGERMHRMAAARHRELQLSDADFARADAIARDRLSGGGRAERAELLEAFREGGVSTEGQRGVHLLGHLARGGLIVLSGRSEYALLAEHVREPRRLDPDAAADELALRYFTGHGPATVRDLAWWTGLPLTLVRVATERVRDRLDELVVDGVVHYLRPGLEPAGGVQLLPGFDEYLLGYGDRSAALAPEHSEAIVPGGNGMFLSTIVSRGEVLGTWRRERGTKAVRLTLAPFEPLPVDGGAGCRCRRAALREVPAVSHWVVEQRRAQRAAPRNRRPSRRPPQCSPRGSARTARGRWRPTAAARARARPHPRDVPQESCRRPRPPRSAGSAPPDRPVPRTAAGRRPPRAPRHRSRTGR